MTELTPVLAGVSLLANVIMAIVAWGWRAEIATIRAEMRAGLAEALASFWRELNGSYIKRDLYNTLVSRVDALENRVNDLGD